MLCLRSPCRCQHIHLAIAPCRLPEQLWKALVHEYNTKVVNSTEGKTPDQPCAEHV